MFRRTPTAAARRRRTRRPSPLALAALLAGLSPALSAQAADDDVRAQLAEALELIRQLTGRIETLEADRDQAAADAALEAQLQALVTPEPGDGQQVGGFDPQSPFGSAPGSLTPTGNFPLAGNPIAAQRLYNPTIGVFIDAIGATGNTRERMGDAFGDRFSILETEVDIRSPIAPFADGVLILARESEGDAELEAIVEEGYADVDLDTLTGIDSDLLVRVGRFRLDFGADNRLHTHDLPLFGRPDPSVAQLGGDGLIGDGMQLMVPFTGTDPNATSATTASLAVVNGDVFAGHHSVLDEFAEDNGLELSGDAPAAVARLSHFTELTPLSNLEVGVSHIQGLSSDVLLTDVGSKVQPRSSALDVTLRLNDDESRQRSWFIQGLVQDTVVDFNDAGVAGFPVGTEEARGFSLIAQRQVAQNLYLGARVSETDVLAEGMDRRAIEPYVAWYANEFFRIRLQGGLFKERMPGVDTRAHRALVQFTWNFGAHRPHPYWANL